MSVTHLISILIGFRLAYTVLVQKAKNHTIKPLEVLSIIATARS